MVESNGIKRRLELLAPVVDERTRRLVCPRLGWGDGRVQGNGGLSACHRAGCEGVVGTPTGHERRVRREGGGRKKTAAKNPTLLANMERLVEPVTGGDPESPLRWTRKRLRKLAVELKGMGPRTSQHLVADLLHALGYSLQANRKRLQGTSHPYRDAQFGHIIEQVEVFQASGDPVISVDT